MKESQINPQEHSDIKVLLLRKYLEKYINILSLAPHVNEVDLHDLFCGEGVYENLKEGSPVIILNLITDIYNKNRDLISGRLKFNCKFNDWNAEKIAKLNTTIEKLKLLDNNILAIKLTNNDYNDVKKTLFNKSKNPNKRTFVFIDPYGYKDVLFSDIKKVLADGYTEVLLFLPTQFMYRFEKDATPESLQLFLNEANERVENKGSRSGVDFINKLKEGFKANLGGKHYVDSFVITRGSNQFFAMFFFTSHIYGFEKFLEAKWDIDEDEGRGWSPKKQGQSSLFDEVDTKPSIDKFEENLIEYLREKRTNIEIHQFTIANCSHLIIHANKILKNLQDNGRLNVKLIDGKDAKRGSFYIGWNEVKTKSPKSYIQLI